MFLSCVQMQNNYLLHKITDAIGRSGRLARGATDALVSVGAVLLLPHYMDRMTCRAYLSL